MKPVATSALFFLILLAGSSVAHEVYVLDDATIRSDFGTHGINVFDALSNPNALHLFLFGTGLVIIGFILLSYLIHTKISHHLNQKFSVLRKYAHLIIRVGLGVSFIWGAYHNCVFGPEIPLYTIPGGMLWKPVLLVTGLLLVFGAATRLAALLSLAVFITVASARGIYMMNYLNYLGEIIVLVLERGELFSVDEHIKWPSHIFHKRLPEWIEKLEAFGEKYSFPIIRMCFGIALIWAAVSVKILYPALSLDVLHNYGLDVTTAFTALFVVLTAGFIEILLGVVLVTGIMYRPTLIVLIAFIGYSVWFFGEEVWPHAILVALGVGLFIHGKDRLSLEDWFFERLWKWTRRFRKSASPLSPQ